MSRPIGMARRGWPAALLASGLSLSGCDQADMVTQGKSGTWDKSPFLPKQAVMQAPIPGTLPRDPPNQPVPQPVSITPALVARGQERFDIFCTPCHGSTGKGDGMIVQRGFPKPPNLSDDRLRKAKAQYFYDVVTVGHGTMYSFADRVPPADRWAIAAYIRALQTSQSASPADLAAEDQAALKTAAP